MGTLIHFGQKIRERDGRNISGTGRVTEGFKEVYQALRENGYELLYEGEPIGDPRVALREKAAIEGQQEAAPTQPKFAGADVQKAAWQDAPIYDLGKGNIISLNELSKAKLRYKTLMRLPTPSLEKN